MGTQASGIFGGQNNNYQYQSLPVGTVAANNPAPTQAAQAGGIGGAVSGLFGGQDTYQGSVQAPSAGLYQLPGQAQNQQLLQAMFSGGTQATPLATAASFQGPSTSQDNQTAAQQNALAAQLQQTASGQGPSVASQQLQQGLQQQLAQQQAAASSMTGDVNPFLAQRQASNQAAAANQATNAQMGQQRAQEALTAQNSLGSVLSGIRGQGQSMQQLQQGAAQGNAQLQQQAALQNQTASLQQQQQNNQAQQYAATGLLGLGTAQLQGNEALGTAQLGASQSNNTTNQAVALQNAQSAQTYGQGLLGGIASGISSVF